MTSSASTGLTALFTFPSTQVFEEESQVYFPAMNGNPLAPCCSSWFFYSKLLQRNRLFHIFRKSRTGISLLYTYSLLLLMYSYNWWNFIFLPNENSNADLFLIIELPFAMFNRSLSFHIRYCFWTYWLLPSTFPT